MTVRELILQLVHLPQSYKVKICVMDQPNQKVHHLDLGVVDSKHDDHILLTCFIDVPKEEPCDCCDRAGEYNGFASGPLVFTCPKHCMCHD